MNGHRRSFHKYNNKSTDTERNNKYLGPPETERLCKAKDTVNTRKRQPTEWKKIFTNPTSDRGLISKIYKELKKLDIKIPNNPIKK